ncbi:MAG TPA: nitronate monooxygenase, partial [Paraburkholderia sp.]|nr:nitronate monooxygenase [Paraburkholderia sp.]
SREQNGDYVSLWSGQGAPLGRQRSEGVGAANLVAQLDLEWHAAVSRIAALER